MICYRLLSWPEIVILWSSGKLILGVTCLLCKHRDTQSSKTDIQVALCLNIENIVAYNVLSRIFTPMTAFKFIQYKVFSLPTYWTNMQYIIFVHKLDLTELVYMLKILFEDRFLLGFFALLHLDFSTQTEFYTYIVRLCRWWNNLCH
jgi:hypothetical protein